MDIDMLNLRRAVRGDERAFETLIGPYLDTTYRLCLRMMGNEQDAADMAQEALVLRDVHGMTYEEIAQILDVNLNTVKSRISRARAALRAILSEGRNFPAGRASKGAEGRDGK